MKKIIATCIIALFIGVGFTSGLGVNVEKKSYPLNTGELAWWKASDCDGTTLFDCSGHNYNGTIYGADWTPGCCLNFDGIDDYVDLDNHSVALGMNKTDDYIVQIRFKSTGSGMFYSMSHSNPDRAYFDLMLDNEGKVGVIMGDVTCTFDLFTTGSYNDGDWHILESEFWGDTTNPTLNLYVDGDLDATTTEWLCPMLDEDFLTAKLGRDSNAESDYFSGIIDDIKIYKGGPPPPPPLDLIITGPDSGKPGQKLTYVFTRVYWYGDEWECNIDWGDGNHERIWVNNDAVTVSHVWDAQGTYIITAFAMDDSGRIGPTATKQVTIPRNKIINRLILIILPSTPNLFPILQKLFSQLEFNKLD